MDISGRYPHISHEREILIAETTLLRRNGAHVTIRERTGSLYNRYCWIDGAIESIRDITEH
jgi:hypothetical protein